MPPQIEIQIADLHIGSKLGLCPPKALLDLGGAYSPNSYQRWLFRQWGSCWDDVDAWIARIENGTKLYRHLSIVGDMADIDAKGRSRQIWGRDVSIVTEVAMALLEPVIARFDAVHVFKGTEAHNGLNNDIESTIAADMTNSVPCQTTGEAAWWYGDIQIGGVVFDIQHHGRLGGMPHTQSNALGSIRSSVIQYRIDSGDRIPDVVTRAHRHYFDETSRESKPYVVSLPGWQHKTAFGHRIDTAGRMPECGIVAFVCDNGKFETQLTRRIARRDTLWKPDTKK